jgi:hypothetical protein
MTKIAVKMIIANLTEIIREKVRHVRIFKPLFLFEGDCLGDCGGIVGALQCALTALPLPVEAEVKIR